MTTTTTSVRSTRKGKGALVHEGMPGIDTVHDRWQSDSIANRCSPAGNIAGRCSPAGKPNWAFDTAVPRPWQKAPDQRNGRHLGPGDYETASRNHLASSPSRAGPGQVGGRPVEPRRLSTAFSSVTRRGLTQSESKQPSKQAPPLQPYCSLYSLCAPFALRVLRVRCVRCVLCAPCAPPHALHAPPMRPCAPARQTKEDFFILRSDHRRDLQQRSAWSQSLSQRVPSGIAGGGGGNAS